MGFGGKSPTPQAPPMPPPAAHPPTLGSSQTALSNIAEQTRARAAEGAGFDNTIKTSPQGLQAPVSTAKATLLGG